MSAGFQASVFRVHAQWVMCCSHEIPAVRAQLVLAYCLGCRTRECSQTHQFPLKGVWFQSTFTVRSEFYTGAPSNTCSVSAGLYLWASHMKRTMCADFCFKSWTVLSFLVLYYKYEPRTAHVPRQLVRHMSSWTIHKPWILVYCCEFWTVHSQWGLHYSESLHNTHTRSAGSLLGI